MSLYICWSVQFSAQMIMRCLLLALLISVARSRAPRECEVKCGDEEGKPALCQYFCARSSELVRKQNISRSFYCQIVLMYCTVVGSELGFIGIY